MDNGKLTLDNGKLKLDNGQLTFDNGKQTLDNGKLTLDIWTMTLDNAKLNNMPTYIDPYRSCSFMKPQVWKQNIFFGMQKCTPSVSVLCVCPENRS